MRFLMKKAAFLTALDKAEATVSNKDNDPLLKSFNIEADPDQVRILSTDMQLGSIARVKVVDVKDKGAVCVPAQKLRSIVRAAEDGDIDFSVSENQATVKAGRYTATLNVLGVEEYPHVPRFNPENAEEVSREKLLDVIQKVRYAASVDEVRPPLMLIAFNGTRAATSDGSRLQVADFKGLENVQIPIFAVGNLVKLLGRSEYDKINVEQQDNHLLFQVGPDTFSTQRLYEEFPNVESMILEPAEKNDLELTVDKEQLVKAVQRVRLSADEERKQMDIQVLEAKNGSTPTEIEVRAQDSEGEHAKETVPCTTTLEAGRTISVNHQYFLDALEMSPAKQVTLRLGQDGKARRSALYMKDPGVKSVLLQLRTDD